MNWQTILLLVSLATTLVLILEKVDRWKIFLPKPNDWQKVWEKGHAMKVFKYDGSPESERSGFVTFTVEYSASRKQYRTNVDDSFDYLIKTLPEYREMVQEAIDRRAKV